MAFDWDRLFRRYVSDEIRTPYGTAPDKMTRTQARYEIFAYTLLMAVVFTITGIVSISGKLPHGDSPGVAIYAFFMVWAVVAFGYSKNQMAAAFARRHLSPSCCTSSSTAFIRSRRCLTSR